VSDPFTVTNSKIPVLKSVQFLSGELKHDVKRRKRMDNDRGVFKAIDLNVIQIYYYLA
jgi:L-asparaginase/Glu-tRNA(Gln) amidotransferase subunit D